MDHYFMVAGKGLSLSLNFTHSPGSVNVYNNANPLYFSMVSIGFINKGTSNFYSDREYRYNLLRDRLETGLCPKPNPK